jgi:hypothetical protein
MKEKEAEAQYEIISKMSFSEILELLGRGCDNPVYSRNLRQGDTAVYGGSFQAKSIKLRLGFVESLPPVQPLDGMAPQFNFFIVSKIIEPPVSAHYGESDRKGIQYWMYRIRFVSDNLFKSIYTIRGRAHGGIRANMMLKIDRPTIVFNVTTGDKWICDWKHPKEYGKSGIKSPPLKYHSGSASIFDSSQIVIITPNTLSDKFLNWNSNPFEVKR